MFDKNFEFFYQFRGSNSNEMVVLIIKSCCFFCQKLCAIKKLLCIFFAFMLHLNIVYYLCKRFQHTLSICFSVLYSFLIFTRLVFQISGLKPATSYVFLVRAENSHGLSVPSGLSNVIKTLGSESGTVPPSEISEARAVLSGKVSTNDFLFFQCVSECVCVCLD